MNRYVVHRIHSMCRGIQQVSSRVAGVSADWTLEEALLDFKYVPGHHDGESLGDEVIKILEEY